MLGKDVDMESEVGGGRRPVLGEGKMERRGENRRGTRMEKEERERNEGRKGGEGDFEMRGGRGGFRMF